MQTNYELKKSIKRYVVPFRISKSISFSQAISIIESLQEQHSRKQGDGPVWVRQIAGDIIQESDAYEYIRGEFRFDSENTALSDKKSGASWVHWNSTISPIRNGKPVKKLIIDKDGVESTKLDISNLGLYIFKNGIGFLWYDLYLSKECRTSEELIELQYGIKELNRSLPCLWEHDYAMPFSLGQWLYDIVEPLNPNFFSSRKSAYSSLIKNAKKMLEKQGDKEVAFEEVEPSEKQVPDKALLYTYAIFDDLTSHEDLEAITYYLTNGYKTSYKIAKECMSEIKYPFDNVAWFATKEGCAIVATYDESNKEFLNTGLPKKVENDYFNLYIKVLFQSYSLLLYAERIQEEIAIEEDAFLIQPIGDEVHKLYGEINLFITKSMATSVSYIHHQSEFFVYLKERLRIQEDVLSVSSGLEALDSLQREEQKVIEEHRQTAQIEEEKNRDSRVQFIMGLITILGVTSVFLDLWNFAYAVATGGYTKMSLVLIIIGIIFGTTYVIFMALAWQQVKKSYRNERPEETPGDLDT